MHQVAGCPPALPRFDPARLSPDGPADHALQDDSLLVRRHTCTGRGWSCIGETIRRDGSCEGFWDGLPRLIAYCRKPGCWSAACSILAPDGIGDRKSMHRAPKWSASSMLTTDGTGHRGQGTGKTDTAYRWPLTFLATPDKKEISEQHTDSLLVGRSLHPEYRPVHCLYTAKELTCTLNTVSWHVLLLVSSIPGPLPVPGRLYAGLYTSRSPTCAMHTLRNLTCARYTVSWHVARARYTVSWHIPRTSTSGGTTSRGLCQQPLVVGRRWAGPRHRRLFWRRLGKRHPQQVSGTAARWLPSNLPSDYLSGWCRVACHTSLTQGGRCLHA